LANLFEIFIHVNNGYIYERWINYSNFLYPHLTRYIPAFAQLEKILQDRGYPGRSEIFLNDLLVNWAIYVLAIPVGSGLIFLDFARNGRQISSSIYLILRKAERDHIFMLMLVFFFAIATSAYILTSFGYDKPFVLYYHDLEFFIVGFLFHCAISAVLTLLILLLMIRFPDNEAALRTPSWP
jgi:hypothetical protein